MITQTKKALLLLLTASFLAAQMSSLAQAAFYGPGDHEHKEVRCEMCLNVKHQDHAVPPSSDGEPFLFHYRQAEQPSVFPVVLRDDCGAAVTRGPPLFS